MLILILGLILFLGIHLVPALPPLRRRASDRFGEDGYKRMFSLVSAAGLVLIVIGYAWAPAAPRLFAPFEAARVFAPVVMIVSFILLAAANMKTHLRRTLGHPMLIGVGLWAGIHLFANGELRATLLFGAFLGYVALDLVSASLRHAVKPFAPVARQDAIAIGAGIALALAVMALHRLLFGVTVVPWGI